MGVEMMAETAKFQSTNSRAKVLPTMTIYFRSTCFASLVVAVSILCGAEWANAQEPAKNAGPKTAAPTAVAPPPAATKITVPIPDNSKLTLMIQLHVAALGLANLTGNYTVLHALGSPTFQAENPPAKLAENFAPFRSKGIDISPALLFPPVLLATPRPEAKDIVRVVGYYNTSPQRIVFEIAFQAVNNAWRLADIKVQTVVPDTVAQAAPAGAVPAAPATAKAPADETPTKPAKAATKK
jgi:hypothetical protein